MATAITRTKKYQALLAALGSEEEALATYRRLHGDVDPRIKQLTDAGYTEEQARRALAIGAEQKVEKAEPEVADPKKVTEAMVAQAGLTFTKGRVYMTRKIAAAVVKCLETGEPAIIKSSGKGRTKAVLISLEPTGDVSVQNLTEPA